MIVYKVENLTLGGSFYSHDMQLSTMILEDAEVGDEFKITVEEMDEAVYNELPEFDGF